MKQNQALVLASASPRRKELLTALGLKFEIFPSNIIEVGYKGSPENICQKIALQKTKNVKARLSPSFAGWILGADTLVALNGRVYGKPADDEDALNILKTLSGQTHQVITSFRLESMDDQSCQKTHISHVTFNTFDDALIRQYLSNKEHMDKAGAYALQGFGSCLVNKVEGSLSNVIGLPIESLYEVLLEYKIISN